MSMYRKVEPEDFEAPKWKRLHLGFDELKRLLSYNAFLEYAKTYDHIYVTFTQTGSYFVVMDFDDNALAICTTLPELEAYYGKTAGNDNSEEA